VAEQIKGIAASPEMLEATLHQIRQQVTDDPRGAVAEAEVAAALVEFSRLWDMLTSAEKSRVLSLLVEGLLDGFFDRFGQGHKTSDLRSMPLLSDVIQGSSLAMVKGTSPTHYM
jgi:hypothetical protein